MTTTLAFKGIIDLPEWRPLSAAPTTVLGGACLCSDLRNSEDRIPVAYYLASPTLLYAYHYKNDGWLLLPSPALTTTGNGDAMAVAPARGPRGTIAAGATNTSFTLSTALPATVGVNQLANRCDGIGYKVRIIDTTAGKTEERYVVGNTSGSTPLITVNSAFSFVPATGATYEFLSGRVYVLGGGPAISGQWRAYDVLTNSILAALSVTNLPTIGTDSSLVVLDELHVPATNSPGEGFLLGTGDGGVNGQALTATAATATTLTGQTASGDSGVATNEYRNFQIRIIKDVTNKTAVGQRRKITSHTAGINPVYTVSTWTVTPSASAQYVIENANEILLLTSGAATVYTYCADAIGAASADTWSSTTYDPRSGGVASSGTCAWQPFGMALDAAKLARYSFIYSFRGGGSVGVDRLDIAGGATGLWSNGIVYGGSGGTFTSGTCCCYDPLTAYAYINLNGTALTARFDSKNRVLESWANMRYTTSATIGGRMAMALLVDGATRVALPTILQANSINLLQTVAR